MENLLGEFTPLLYALFLATANSELVDFLKTPIERRYPQADLWWFQYVNIITGAVIGWFGLANIFVGPLEVNEVFGRVMTAFLIGGGSNLIFRVFKQSS